MKNETEVNLMSPLVWAYVGDSVYELFIRCHLVNNSKLKPIEIIVYEVKQSKMMFLFIFVLFQTIFIIDFIEFYILNI